MDEKNNYFESLKLQMFNHKIVAILAILIITGTALLNFSNSIHSLVKQFSTTSKKKLYSEDEILIEADQSYFQHSNYQKAFELYQKSANAGNPIAQAAVAKLLWRGLGVEKDRIRAKFWAERSLLGLQILAEVENEEALYSYAFLLEAGIVVEVDNERAFELYELSAWKGYAPAQYNYAHFYANAVGVERNLNKAFKWYMEAARSGYPVAQIAVGDYFRNGTGTAKDYNKAKRWYNEAVKSGSQDAKFSLSMLRIFNSSTDDEVQVGVTDLLDLAEANYSIAQRQVGLLYKDGVGVERNYELAVKWFERAIENGNIDVATSLAVHYIEGLGVGKDEQKALSYLKEAAEGNDALAIGMMGEIYRKGLGVEIDYNEAIRLYKSAIDMGLDYARIPLAYMYSNEIGVSRNHKKSFELLNSLISKYKSPSDVDVQYAAALNNLGSLYENGEGIDKNEKLAYELVEAAAKKGLSFAKANLARFLADGIGVKVDIKKAKEWVEASILENEGYGYYVKAMFVLDQNKSENKNKFLSLLNLASMRDHPCAMNELALLLEEEGKESQAYELYYKASFLRSSEATYNFSRLHNKFSKIGNKIKSTDELVAFLKKRADYNEIDAMLILGSWYQDGVVLEKDKISAGKYLFAVDNLGSKAAEERLKYFFYPEKQTNKSCKLELIASNR